MTEINDLVNEINRDVQLRQAVLNDALVGVAIITTAVVAGVVAYKLHKRISAVEEQQQHTPE